MCVGERKKTGERIKETFLTYSLNSHEAKSDIELRGREKERERVCMRKEWFCREREREREKEDNFFSVKKISKK